MADYTLPNGKTLKGLDKGYSPDEIRQIALEGGYATDQDYQKNMETGADWATFTGELTGGVGGAIAGGMAGSAILPGPGTFLGGLIGGAAGTFMGSMAGQTAEASLENREADFSDISKKAGHAAAVDTLYGLGFGVAGKGIKMIAEPLLRLAKPASKVTPEVDTLLSLQDKLKGFNTGLLPSQIGDTSAGGRAAETYAASSKAFGPEYDKIVQGFDDYTIEATDTLLSKLSNASREDVGAAFQKLSSETEKAVKEVVDPLYKTIDQEGGLAFDTKALNDSVAAYLKRATSGGVGRVSAKATEASKLLAGLPQEITPAMLASDISPIVNRLEALAKSGDAQSTGVLNILKTYVAKVKNNPALIDTGAASSAAKAVKMSRVSEAGDSRIGGAYANAVDYVSGLRKKMSFSETKEELSYLKQQLRDAENPASPSSAAAKVYSSAIAKLENAMETAAKNFNPELYDKYRYVSDFYKKGQETVYSPFMKEALRAKEPAKVGELLARVGFVTPTKELDEVVKLANGLGVSGGVPMREAITRSYLENMFKTGDAASLNQFNKEMSNARFRDTFNTVVPSDLSGPILQLAEEAAILARHASGGSAASLGVGSREIAALETPGRWKSIAFGLLPGVVRGRLSNEAITGKLKAMEQINKQIARGEQPGAGLIAYVVKGLPTIGIRTGVTLGTATEK